MIQTNISYPEGLPYPNREGYELNHVSPFRRTSMQSGRAIQRRVFTSVPTMVGVSWVFTGDGPVAAFEAWFRDQVKDGTEWFNCPLKTPIGTQDYVCRFVSMYQGPRLVGLCSWMITAELEIFERPLLPEGWGEFPEFMIDADIIDIAMNNRWPRA